MKQTPQQNKNLILGDLMYAFRHVAEFKAYASLYTDPSFDKYKSNLEMSLDSLNSAIRLIAESEIK